MQQHVNVGTKRSIERFFVQNETGSSTTTTTGSNIADQETASHLGKIRDDNIAKNKKKKMVTRFVEEYSVQHNWKFFRGDGMNL